MQAPRDRQGETFQGISHYSQNTFKDQNSSCPWLTACFCSSGYCKPVMPQDSYKIDFLQCQARHRRFHPVNWVDATPHGAALFTGLLKCFSCKSILLCHSTAWLAQLSPATQKFGSSSRFGKAAPQSLLLHARRNGSVNSRWDMLCCSQNGASFKRPKAVLWSVNRCNAPHHLTYWGVFCQRSQWNPRFAAESHDL